MSSIIILVLIGLVTIALIIFIIVNHQRNDVDEPQEKVVNKNIECCGAHEVCEAETLLAMSAEIIYYSDEELDAYKGIAADGYNETQIDEFREILFTLQMHEVSGWLKSLQLRQIEIPLEIRDEALMIVEEFRQKRIENRLEKSKQQIDGK